MVTLSADLMRDDELSPMPVQLRDRAARTPHAIAFEAYDTGTLTPTARVTWSGWYAASCAVAARLMHAGVQVGDRVAVLSSNRPLWPIADIALQMIGAIGVGIYPTSSLSQVTAILRDSGALFAFAAGEIHANSLRLARAELDAPIRLVVSTTSEPASNTTDPVLGQPHEHSWSEWLREGSAFMRDPNVQTALTARIDALSLDQLAALIYTSGSTGTPKGACISHRYLAASARSIADVLQLTDADRSLSFLPYSHAAERVFGQCTRIATGMAAALIEDPADVFRVARVYAPTLLGGLPRIFERLYEAADTARHSGADPRAAIVDRIGPHCRIATSGGATMPVHIARDLEQLGLLILGAYGQTEHLCVAMTRPSHVRFDTVGAPMPGTRVRIAADGELLIARSALTFSGYWNNAEATRAAYTEDGQWLKTGDRAEQDADGMLRITGRVKELIALSTGRKIAPLPIESALMESPYVAHAVCYGEGRKYLTALISLRRRTVEHWARSNDIDAPWPMLATHARVQALVADAVARVNESLAGTDRIQKFATTDHEFSLEGGELTPTLKLMRAVIGTRYAPQFEALYQ